MRRQEAARTILEMGEGGYREGKGIEGTEIAWKQGPANAGREGSRACGEEPRPKAASAQSKAPQGATWAQRLRAHLPSAHSWPVSVFR